MTVLSQANLDNDALDPLALEIDASQGEKVAKSVFYFLGRIVCYPSEAAQIAHALWCIHTHFMAAWKSTPRLWN